jgi:hypothetical protein
MWSCDSHTLFASLLVHTFRGKRLRIAKLRDWRLGKKRFFHVLRKLTPETAADEAARFSGPPDKSVVRGRSGNQPAVYLLFRQERTERCELLGIQIFLNSRVDDGKKTGEVRGAKSFDRERGIWRLQRMETNGQEQFRLRLKFVNPPAEGGSIGLEKDVVTTLRDGSNKMTDPGMKQRFTAANPDYRSGILQEGMHLFVGNRRNGAGMKDLSRIHTMKYRSRRCGIENLRDAGFREF